MGSKFYAREKKNGRKKAHSAQCTVQTMDTTTIRFDALTAAAAATGNESLTDDRHEAKEEEACP
jgi:hypothetical protein